MEENKPEKVNQGMVMKALDYAYDKATNGFGTENSAVEIAAQYLQENGNAEQAIDKLVRWHTTKSAVVGFATGLGGILTLPITIPANLFSVLFIQIRMIIAIAILSGFDPKDERVKTMVLVCLTGNAASNILRGAGVRIGEKLTEKLIAQVSVELISKINKAVGFKLLTKGGKTGLINLGKAIPIMGGVFGAAFDAGSTRIVGRTAKKIFWGKRGNELIINN